MANVLVIMMDDMRADEMAFMPNVRRLIRGKGTHFTGARVNIPLCSPARTGLITGQYSKHHGVDDNGDTTDWDDSVFVALNNAGYRVGGIGKMVSAVYATVKRPGFDEWQALKTSATDPGFGIYNDFDFDLHNGTTATNYTAYQDHVLARFGIDFILGSEPWALWYCPTADHWPWNSPPNHTTEYALADFDLTLEADVSDKPSWISSKPVPSAAELAEMQAEQRIRLRELQSADDAIGAMVATIAASGQADDTTIIFTSDNGNMLGEHRIIGGLGVRAGTKNTPYDPSLKVPLVAIGPGFPHQTVTTPTNHQDITATMLDIANTSAILPHQAGISLVDIAANPSAYASRQLIHRRTSQADVIPSANGISSATRKLWRYVGVTGTDKYEMYDIDTDPDEHINVANDPARLTERNALEADLDAFLTA